MMNTIYRAFSEHCEVLAHGTTIEDCLKSLLKNLTPESVIEGVMEEELIISRFEDGRWKEDVTSTAVCNLICC